MIHSGLGTFIFSLLTAHSAMLAAVVKRKFRLLMKNSFTTKGHIKDYDCMKEHIFVVVIRKSFFFCFVHMSLTIHQEISKLMPVFIQLYRN